MKKQSSIFNIHSSIAFWRAFESGVKNFRRHVLVPLTKGGRGLLASLSVRVEGLVRYIPWFNPGETEVSALTASLPQFLSTLKRESFLVRFFIMKLLYLLRKGLDEAKTWSLLARWEGLFLMSSCRGITLIFALAVSLSSSTSAFPLILQRSDASPSPTKLGASMLTQQSMSRFARGSQR